METPSRLSASTSIVFDTNVLISAFIFKNTAGEVYQYCAERYTLFTTDWLLDELQDVLSRKKFRLPTALQLDILDQVKEDMQLVHPNNSLPTDSIDPDDNYVLQAALFVQANFLITGDEKHLLPLAKVENVELIRPALFFDRYIRQ